MQYSPPKIAFKPLATKPIFAVCEIDNGTVGAGSFQFAQFKGKPTLYRASFVAPLSAFSTAQSL